MATVVTRTELKTYLGLTTTADDSLLDQVLEDATAQAEQDTSRVFAASSNVARVYSTDGQAAIVVHDRPYTDPSRTVVLDGTTLTEDTDVWFLQDRRDGNVSTTIQLRYFDRSTPHWYKANPDWFDKNLDQAARRGASPNDLTITGIIGHPFPHRDVLAAVKLLAAWMYWRAKSGASGTVSLPDGTPIELSDLPAGYSAFVGRWKIRTGVVAV